MESSVALRLAPTEAQLLVADRITAHSTAQVTQLFNKRFYKRPSAGGRRYRHNSGLGRRLVYDSPADTRPSPERGRTGCPPRLKTGHLGDPVIPEEPQLNADTGHGTRDGACAISALSECPERGVSQRFLAGMSHLTLFGYSAVLAGHVRHAEKVISSKAARSPRRTGVTRDDSMKSHARPNASTFATFSVVVALPLYSISRPTAGMLKDGRHASSRATSSPSTTVSLRSLARPRSTPGYRTPKIIVVARPQMHRAARPESDGAIAVELELIGPFASVVWQLVCAKEEHRPRSGRSYGSSLRGYLRLRGPRLAATLCRG